MARAKAMGERKGVSSAVIDLESTGEGGAPGPCRGLRAAWERRSGGGQWKRGGGGAVEEGE